MGAMLPAPMSAWVEEPGGYNGPGLVLGFGPSEGSWFVVCDDGHIRGISTIHVTVDWRYNWKTHEWIEVSGLAEEEPSDDGSEELSGPVPDVDGGGGGDPIDEEGGSPAGGPGGVDTEEERREIS